MDTLDHPAREALPIGHAVWQAVRADAVRVAAQEETLTAFLHETVLAHDRFADALWALLVRKLACRIMPAERLGRPVADAMADDPAIVASAAADLAAILARDPAADSALTPFLYFKGFHALQWHRIAHWLWGKGRHDLAHFLQSRVSEAFAVDIHPAVPVGRGVFIDHGTGVVIGETAVIGNDVSILQNVTLGGTGKEHGDRHPKVKDGVLLAAGAKVLGNITLGARSKIGAGSVVLKDVPPCATVAGVPAKVVGWCRDDAAPALTMDMSLQQADYSI
ncbi:serine O-acetyltransferase [Azospirillum thermophilum]|uniref:Serine acetyltransferase n=1 Tax=Azospirillum thermophilum TaxID=2202148 RepID=A0A2S2CZI4_9PROT|nr:serine O-acetyltransferase [Azospirillum thermophilum]AWK89924.1 serine O-acetyltransferase [Azospirillum thermophilum]